MSAEPVSGVRVTSRDERCAEADRFQVLFRRYYGRVKGLAARRFPAFDSDDVAQETMVRLLVHVGRLDPDRDPWPYIAAITVNVGRDFARAQLPEAPLTEEAWEREVAPAADEPVLAADHSATVQNVLASLAPASRQVLALQAYDEMTVREIASFLGTNDNAVRQKLFRARRQFRQAIAGVPSGAFGIGVLVMRVRRRVSAANLAQGTGLSLTSAAAAIAVAVAGAVTYSALPERSGTDASAAPAPAFAVRPVRAHDGGSPETPDKARRPRTGAAAVAARPGRPGGNGSITLPAQPPVGRVRVDNPNAKNVVGGEGETHRAEVVVPTPFGDLTIRNVGHAGQGSTACQVVRLRDYC